MNHSTARPAVPSSGHRAVGLLGSLATAAALCLALATSAPAQQDASRSFVGTFASSSTRLTLTQATNGQIEGQMTVGSTALGLTASVYEGAGGAPVLRGHLTQGARRFGFEAEPTSLGLRVTSGGKSRELRRVESAQRSSQPKVLRLHRRAIQDPVMNIPSHHVLLPTGFQIDGGPVWTPNAPAFQTMNVRIHDGSGAEICFAPRQYFEYEPQHQLAMKGLRVGMQMPTGQVVMPPPQSREDLVRRHLVPALRPQASGLRIKKFEELPEATEAIRRLPTLNMPTLPGHRRERTVEIVGVEVTYNEGGRQFDENILYVFMQTDNVMDVGMGPRWNTGWVFEPMLCIRTPSEQTEDRMPLLSQLACNVRPTAQWYHSQQEVFRSWSTARHNRHMERQRTFANIARQAARTNAEISDMQMQTWRNQQASQDRIQRKTTDMISGTERYTNRDGLTLSIDQRFDHVYEAADGSILAVEGNAYEPHKDPAVSHLDWRSLGRQDG